MQIAPFKTYSPTIRFSKKVQPKDRLIGTRFESELVRNLKKPSDEAAWLLRKASTSWQSWVRSTRRTRSNVKSLLEPPLKAQKPRMRLKFPVILWLDTTKQPSWLASPTRFFRATMKFSLLITCMPCPPMTPSVSCEDTLGLVSRQRRASCSFACNAHASRWILMSSVSASG